MKPFIAKSTFALSALALTIGSGFLLKENINPSITFRTIANIVESRPINKENIRAELAHLKTNAQDVSELHSDIKKSLSSDKASLSKLIKLRDKSLEKLEYSNEENIERLKEVTGFISNEPQYAFQLNKEIAQIKEDISIIKIDDLQSKLEIKIKLLSEDQILKQQEEINITNEKICENKNLLVDIKEKLNNLLKDKKEVVKAVEKQSEEKVQSQRELVRFNELFTMMSMMQIMKSYQSPYQAPYQASYQNSFNPYVNSYHRQAQYPFYPSNSYDQSYYSMKGSYGSYPSSYSYPSTSYFEQPFSQKLAISPLTNPNSVFMNDIQDTSQQARVIPGVKRSNGLVDVFNFSN